ncbi:ribosome hibernation-promoting factor, HPF/YfiA family [Sandarakinorhabdus sp.]|uniref:ribosome hibernation-promoting factor, HPF/YfiA family n=1 Tax=Sandarakinorhabdus sp. TaxID=1916663 RepID=UPI00286E76BE|nr:ribosome-associated translation inhibitor RaiA [Sandarakinorhabdus sp.]
MDIRISGHQVDTGAAFGAHVRDRLSAMVTKYFPRAISAHVTLGPAPHGHFGCDIVMHVMADLILKGSGRATDANPAFDAAADRIDKQLRRYKRRLKDRHSPSAMRGTEPMPALDAGPESGPGTGLDNAGYMIFAANAEDEGDIGDAPLVIAETRVDIPQASVSDAVMMLDLRNTNALLFINSASGIHNMVYRREDGTIGWVEPRASGSGVTPGVAIAAQ